MDNKIEYIVVCADTGKVLAGPSENAQEVLDQAKEITLRDRKHMEQPPYKLQIK